MWNVVKSFLKSGKQRLECSKKGFVFCFWICYNRIMTVSALENLLQWAC